MIAKLVTHAPDRLAAIDAQATALDAFVIDGIRHNIPFLSALMQHPRWREGRLSTGFIAEEFPDGFQPARRQGRDRAAPRGRWRRMSTTSSTSASAAFPGSCASPSSCASSSSASSSMGREPDRARDRRRRRAASFDRVRRRPQGRGPFGLEAGRPAVARNRRRRRDRGADAPDPQRLSRSRTPASASTRASTRAARRSSPR